MRKREYIVEGVQNHKRVRKWVKANRKQISLEVWGTTL